MSAGRIRRDSEAKANLVQSELSLEDFRQVVSIMDSFWDPRRLEGAYDMARRLLLLAFDPRKDRASNLQIVGMLEQIIGFLPKKYQAIIENLFAQNVEYRQEILSAANLLANYFKHNDNDNQRNDATAALIAAQNSHDEVLRLLREEDERSQRRVDLTKARNDDDQLFLDEVFNLISANPQYAKSIAQGFLLLYGFVGAASDVYNLAPYKQLMEMYLRAHRVINHDVFKDNKTLLARHPQYAEKIAEGIIYLYRLSAELRESLLNEYRNMLDQYPQYAEDIGYAVYVLANAKILSPENKSLLAAYPQFARNIVDVLRQLGALALSPDVQQALHRHAQYAFIIAIGLEDLAKKSLINKENFDRLILCAPYKQIILCLPILRMASLLNQQNFEALARFREFGEEIFKNLMEINTLDQKAFDSVIQSIQEKIQVRDAVVKPLLAKEPSRRVQTVAAIMFDFLPKMDRQVDAKEGIIPSQLPTACLLHPAKSNLAFDFTFIMKVMREFEKKKGIMLPDRVRRLLPMVFDPKQNHEKNLQVALALINLNDFSEPHQLFIEKLIHNYPLHAQEILLAAKLLAEFFVMQDYENRSKFLLRSFVNGEDASLDINPLSNDDLNAFIKVALNAVAACPKYAKYLIAGFVNLYIYDIRVKENAERDLSNNAAAEAGLEKPPSVALFWEYKALLEKHPQYAEEFARAIVDLHSNGLLNPSRKALLEQYPQYAENLARAFCLLKDPIFSSFEALLVEYPQFAYNIAAVLYHLNENRDLNAGVNQGLRQNIRYIINMAEGLREGGPYLDFNKLLLCAPYKDIISCISLLRMARILDAKNMNVLINYREFGDDILRDLIKVPALNQAAFDDAIKGLQERVQARDVVVNPLLAAHAKGVRDVAAIMFDFLPKVNRQMDANAQVTSALLVAVAPKR